MPQDDIVLGVAERVSARHSNPAGACELMAEELVKELDRRGIRAQHAVGLFVLDFPDADKYAEFDIDIDRDETEVEHDWVEVGGKILDISAKQFRKSVEETIPDIVFIGHAEPLAARYKFLNYYGQ